MEGRVSIVIASAAGRTYLRRCLDSVVGQAQEHGAEVIVADRCGGELRAEIARDYPQVQLIAAPADERPGVPALRRMGVEAARGDIVAVIEEHCAADPDWLKVIERELGPDDAAIGGPVYESEYESLRDWAIYFSEFHNYLPPWTAGPRYALNGVNIAYPRARLLEHVDLLDRGYWEVELHPMLAQEGAFRAVPDMRVHHAGPFDFKLYLEQRYLLSRVWGAGQREKVSTVKRLAYLVLAPVLPLLLLARIAARVFASRRHILRFVLCIPYLVVISVTYVWGEWRGYLQGAGDALERVE